MQNVLVAILVAAVGGFISGMAVLLVGPYAPTFLSGLVGCIAAMVEIAAFPWVAGLVFGLFVGALLQRLAARFDARHPRAFDRWPRPFRQSPAAGPTASARAPGRVINADGPHLIPKPDGFFRLECRRTVDGHEIVARFATRNRSNLPLHIDPTTPRGFHLNGIVGEGGGGGSTPYAPRTTQSTIAGRLTCYNDVKGLKGAAIASISFGVEPQIFIAKLIMEVEFVIESQIDRAGSQGDLAFTILANRTRYEEVAD